MTDHHRNHSWKTLRLKIQGMHCVNCEVLIERKFKKIPGVRRIKVNHISGVAEIVCYGDLDINELQNLIAEDGYTVSLLREQTSKTTGTKNTGRDYVEIAAVFLILVAIYL